MIRTSSFAATTAKLFGAAVFGATVLAAPAQAETITFEDLAYYGPILGNDVVATGNYGIGFYANRSDGAGTLVGTIVTPDYSESDGAAFPVNNQTNYYASLNDGYADIVNLDPGVRFAVNAFDASFVGGTAALSGYPAISGLLRIQGILSGGGSVTETYQLAGPGASGFNFAHYETSAAFRSNLFTEILVYGFACNTAGNCNAFTTDRGQFALDNLALTEVPEPASMALFGLGMVGLTVAARRRKA